MSISHLSLVNQKLAFASSIVVTLNTTPSSTTSAQKLHWQALGDAVVFHLSTALHFYLRELAENYRLKNLTSINSVQDLISALSDADKASSESSELLELIQSNDSWLSQLTRYHEHISKSPQQPKEKKAFEQENLIVAIELTEVESELPIQLNPNLLASWLESFRALVMRQRDTSAEY